MRIRTDAFTLLKQCTVDIPKTVSNLIQAAFLDNIVVVVVRTYVMNAE